MGANCKSKTRNLRENSVKHLRLKVAKGKSVLMDALIVIPARMASTRLPGKPLADIAGLPMIVHVLRAAEAANAGPVVVACAEPEIKDAVERAGGKAVLTDPDLPSGTDRVRQAAQRVDPEGQYEIVVNVQGDMPTLDPSLVKTIIAPLIADLTLDKPLDKSGLDMVTAAVKTTDPREIDDPNVVKAVISQSDSGHSGRALYFTRAAAPSGMDADGQRSVYHHLGVYAYRRAALKRFCALPPSPLERRERLEQLRALEAGMSIHVCVVDLAPHGVDTEDDLARARDVIQSRDIQ